MTVYNIDFAESERKEFEEIALDFRRQENEARNDYITRNARIQEQQRKAFAEFFDRMYAARAMVNPSMVFEDFNITSVNDRAKTIVLEVAKSMGVPPEYIGGIDPADGISDKTKEALVYIQNKTHWDHDRFNHESGNDG